MATLEIDLMNITKKGNQGKFFSLNWNIESKKIKDKCHVTEIHPLNKLSICLQLLFKQSGGTFQARTLGCPFSITVLLIQPWSKWPFHQALLWVTKAFQWWRFQVFLSLVRILSTQWFNSDAAGVRDLLGKLGVTPKCGRKRFSSGMPLNRVIWRWQKFIFLIPELLGAGSTESSMLRKCLAKDPGFRLPG